MRKKSLKKMILGLSSAFILVGCYTNKDSLDPLNPASFVLLPVLDVMDVVITKPMQSIDGIYRATLEKPDKKLEHKFKMLHKGFAPKYILEANGCVASLPIALLDAKTTINTDKKLANIFRYDMKGKSTLSWTGQCQKGFMHEFGVLALDLRNKHSRVKICMKGNMNYGFFNGQVHIENGSRCSGNFKDDDIKVRLGTRDLYNRYEEFGGYDDN